MIRRLAVTIGGVAVYLGGVRLVPLLSAGAAHDAAALLHTQRVSMGSIFALGFAPFITGFLIVEIFSLVTPPGRRLRRDGIEGRRMLNRGGLGVSALVTVAQCWGLALFLTRTGTPSGAPLTTTPAWLLMLTATTGTFAVVGLAELMSRYGLTSGFAALFAAGSPRYIVEACRFLFGRGSDTAPETRIVYTIWVVLLLAALVLFLRRRPETRLNMADGKTLPYRLPPLPQGYLPLMWSYFLVAGLSMDWPSIRHVLPRLGLEGRSAVEALFVLGLSFLGGWMFTARPRVEANLAGLGVVPAATFDRLWWRQLVLAAFVLAVGDAGIEIARGRLPGFDKAILPIASLVLLCALVLDAVDVARLSAKTRLESILILDNVHLAELLRAKLEAEGIGCVVSSFRFRRMFYFLGPLFKMSLLVPTKDCDRAARLVEDTAFEIV